MQMLIVEDEPLLRRGLSRFLAAKGYDVVSAEDGEQAAGLLERGPAPFMLLTDVILTGAVSGVDLAARARSLYADLPIVFMSGYPRSHTEALSSFLDDRSVFLAKPFSLHRVLEIAERFQSA